MRKLMAWMLPAAAATFVLSIVVCAFGAEAEETERAGEKPAAAKAEIKGSVSGKLADQEGNAVSGARVSLVKAPDREARRARKEARASEEQPNTAAADRKRPEPVATATTDEEGKFTLKDVPAGDYTVRAQARGAGVAVTKVTILAGKTADVALTLKPKAELTPEKQAKRDARKQERRAAKKALKKQQ